jgi:hypothetical protein
VIPTYLLNKVPCSYNRATNKTDNIVGGEAVINEVIITIRPTLCEVQMEWNVRNSSWYQRTYYRAETQNYEFTGYSEKHAPL